MTLAAAIHRDYRNTRPPARSMRKPGDPRGISGDARPAQTPSAISRVRHRIRLPRGQRRRRTEPYPGHPAKHPASPRTRPAAVRLAGWKDRWACGSHPARTGRRTRRARRRSGRIIAPSPMTSTGRYAQRGRLRCPRTFRFSFGGEPRLAGCMSWPKSGSRCCSVTTAMMARTDGPEETRRQIIVVMAQRRLPGKPPSSHQ